MRIVKVAEENRLPNEIEDGVFEGRSTFIAPSDPKDPDSTPAVYFRDNGEKCQPQTAELVKKILRDMFLTNPWGFSFM